MRKYYKLQLQLQFTILKLQLQLQIIITKIHRIQAFSNEHIQSC